MDPMKRTVDRQTRPVLKKPSNVTMVPVFLGPPSATVDGNVLMAVMKPDVIKGLPVTPRASAAEVVSVFLSIPSVMQSRTVSMAVTKTKPHVNILRLVFPQKE